MVATNPNAEQGGKSNHKPECKTCDGVAKLQNTGRVGKNGDSLTNTSLGWWAQTMMFSKHLFKKGSFALQKSSIEKIEP